MKDAWFYIQWLDSTEPVMPYVWALIEIDIQTDIKRTPSRKEHVLHGDAQTQMKELQRVLNPYGIHVRLATEREKRLSTYFNPNMAETTSPDPEEVS